MYKLIISGNLTAAVEGCTLAGDIRCANFTVAVNHWQNGAERADFIRCTAWRATAERCEKYLAKGSKVICWGKPSVHAWNGKDDGSARGTIELSIDEIEFAGKPVENSSQSVENVDKSTAVAEPAEMAAADDDDLPF